MIEKLSTRARSEKDITRVSGTLGPSSILGGRTIQSARLLFAILISTYSSSMRQCALLFG
jgi:hypothetical protein